MGRKRKIKDLEGQTVMSFDQPCPLPCEIGEVECRGLQMQDPQKPMEGKHELGDTGNLMEKVADADENYAWLGLMLPEAFRRTVAAIETYVPSGACPAAEFEVPKSMPRPLPRGAMSDALPCVCEGRVPRRGAGPSQAGAR